MKKPNNEKGPGEDYIDKIIEFIMQKGEVSIYELSNKRLAPSRQTLGYNLRKLSKTRKIRVYIKMKPEPGFVFPKPDEIFITIINDFSHPQDVLKLINSMCGTDGAVSEQAVADFVDLYLEKFKKNAILEKKSYFDRMEKHKSELIDEEMSKYDQFVPPKFPPSRLEVEFNKNFGHLTREEYKEKIKESVERSVQKDMQDYIKTNFEDNIPKIKQSAKRLAYGLMCNAFSGLKERVAFSLTSENEKGEYNLINMDNPDEWALQFASNTGIKKLSENHKL